MQETRRNLLVGVFVLCGLAALGTLIVLFGSGPTRLLGREGNVLNIRFESASGIRAGNLVTIGGIIVGRVIDVQFMDPQRFEDGVKVVAIIDEEYPIPNGSRAITTEPVLGQGRPPIEIIPGPSAIEPLGPGAIIEGEMRSAVEAFFPKQVVSMFDKTGTHVGEAAARLTPVLEDLHNILVQRSPQEVDGVGGLQGNLSTAVTRLDSSLKHFNDVLGDPDTKSKLRETIANFHAVSEDAKVVTADLRAASAEARELTSEARTMVADTRGSVDRLESEVTAVSRDARDMLERWTRLLDSLYEMTGAINRREGTVGRLVYDAKLYEALVLTAERLGQTIEEFRVLVKDWQKGKVRVGF